MLNQRAVGSWVRQIENREKAIREITKYVVKFSEFSEEKLIEIWFLRAISSY